MVVISNIVSEVTPSEQDDIQWYVSGLLLDVFWQKLESVLYHCCTPKCINSSSFGLILRFLQHLPRVAEFCFTVCCSNKINAKTTSIMFRQLKIIALLQSKPRALCTQPFIPTTVRDEKLSGLKKACFHWIQSRQQYFVLNMFDKANYFNENVFCRV